MSSFIDSSLLPVKFLPFKNGKTYIYFCFAISSKDFDSSLLDIYYSVFNVLFLVASFVRHSRAFALQNTVIPH
jgi:hypothetical protein